MAAARHRRRAEEATHRLAVVEHPVATKLSDAATRSERSVDKADPDLICRPLYDKACETHLSLQ